MSRGGLWLNAALAFLGLLAFVVAAGFFGYKWLATDEADRAYACGSGKGGGLCTEGETTNMVLALLFGGIGVVFAVFCVMIVRALMRRS